MQNNFHLQQQKEKIILDLLQEVEKRFGLQPTRNLITKVFHVFEKLPESALTQWIFMLKTLPPEHPEWQSFVEVLTVHETYFCRENHILNGIRDVILPKLFERKKGMKEMNIWSAACSTGEEAYNLAILLIESLKKSHEESLENLIKLKIKNWKLNILGTDLSKQVIRIAETGIYNDSIMGSFRTSYQEILPYFDVEKQEEMASKDIITSYRIKPEIKSLVQFQVFNLLSKNPPRRQMDLVLCRNVLIYFNDQHKLNVQIMLDRSLAIGGALVFGTVDTMYLKNYKKHLHNGCLWYEKISHYDETAMDSNKEQTPYFYGNQKE